MNPKIRIIPLGGVNEVGANSYFIDWNGKTTFLLDCGLRSENSEVPTIETLPQIHSIDTEYVDNIIITHAHNDHIGALPFIAKYFLKENGKIIMTEENSEISIVTLQDSEKIMTRKVENKNNNRKDEIKNLFQDSIRKLYSCESINKLFSNHLKTLKYKEEYNIPGTDIIVSLFDASHVLGSAMVYIRDNDYSLLYTGDFNDKPTFIHNGINLPENLRVDILISETTNGSKTNENNDKRKKLEKLVTLINEAYKNGGQILFPSFALGRTQEILIAIAEAKSKNLIPKDIPVYISAGLSAKTTNIYKKYGFKIHNFSSTIKPPRNKTTIFIATSGFFTKDSPSTTYAEEFLSKDNKSVIIFPSNYVYENVIKRLKYEYKCKIECIDMSAHSTAEGIEKFIKKLNPSYTILVHGQQDSVNAISRRFIKTNLKIIKPQTNGEEIIFYKKNNTINVVKSSSVKKAYLITVGVSFNNYIKNHPDQKIEADKDYKIASAELNTLLNIPKLELKNTVCHLIATNKEESINSAIKIAKYLEEGKDAIAVIHIKKFNLEEGKLSECLKMEDITSGLLKIIMRYKQNIVLIFSGGFKFEVAVGYLLANIFDIEAYYKHEQMKEYSPSIRLQKLPVKIDYESYLPYYNLIENLVYARYSKNIVKVYKNLPESIKKLFNIKKDLIFLNYIGLIVYYALKNYEQIKKKNIFKFIIFNSNNSFLTFDQNSVHTPSKEFDVFLNSLIFKGSVKNIKLGKETEIKDFFEKLSVKLITVKQGEVILELKYRKKAAPLTIKTITGYETEILRILDLNSDNKLKIFS